MWIYSSRIDLRDSLEPDRGGLTRNGRNFLDPYAIVFT
jgi:hypothetical protein